MINVTGEKRKVVTETDMAKCETVNLVVCADFENSFGEPKLSKEIPKHLAELYKKSTSELVNAEQRERVFEL